MKKIHAILGAAAVALSMLSCNKDTKPAAPMTPTEVQKKVSDVVVNTLNEIDPDNWKAWGQTGLGLVNEIIDVIRNAETDQSVKDFAQNLEDLFIKEEGNKTITLIKLSQITGSITVENKVVKYTSNNNPVSISLPYNGKIYKAQVEVKGESATAWQIYSRTSDEYSSSISLYVPQTMAIHVTENSSAFLDLSLSPVIYDNNKNGKLDEGDAIGGSLSLQNPAYNFTGTNLTISEDYAEGIFELTHGSTSVLLLDGKLEFDIYSQVKSLLGGLSVSLDDVTINQLSLMGGQAIVKAEADIQDLKSIYTHYSSQADANTAARQISKSLKAELFFDNNPTVQASFVSMVTADGSEGWNVLPGLHFSDGSADMLLSEFFSEKSSAWDSVINKINEITGKLTRYFHDLMPSSK